MRYRRITSVSAAAALTTALALGCNPSSTPLAPGGTAEAVRGATAAAEQVPFKGTFEATGSPAEVPGDRCPVLTVEIHGTGNATHLGSLTTHQSHCVAPPSLGLTDGVFTLTAANGDELRGIYVAELLPLEPPLFTIDGEFTFTGGTGRFAGATGGGDASGVQDLATGDATVLLEGTISSVGSSKAD